MGRTNACRAQTKRDRAAAKAGSKQSSQLKVNEKAKSTQCQVCKQTFLCTVSVPSLREHAENKHPRNGFQECFPSAESK